MKTGVGVEKVRDRKCTLGCITAAIEFFLSPQLSGSFHGGCYRLAEEAHEPLNILSRCGEQELLPHELTPTEEWLLKILSVRAAVSGTLSRHINRPRSQVCRKEEEDKYAPPLLLVLLSTVPGS